MIDFKDAEILDILPFTFKKPREMAMSKTIKQITAIFYAMVCQFDFWVNIDNITNETLLDAMAAELDCPFYATDMPIEQKRDVIKAAKEYNSHVGTVGAIQTVLKAAFGGGEVSEWFEYGGLPYYFTLNIPVDFGGKYVSKEMVENFYKMLSKAKNKRSKLDELTIEAVAEFGIGMSVVVGKRHRRSIIPSTKRAIGASGIAHIGTILANQHRNVIIYPARDADIGYNL